MMTAQEVERVNNSTLSKMELYLKVKDKISIEEFLEIYSLGWEESASFAKDFFRRAS